jgi:protocatechuate 3,4-dioxygenase beta subunit
MMLLPDGSRHTVPAGGGVVTAGDDGRFRITGVEPGIVVLSARAPARASVEPVEIPVAIAEQVADVELVVAAAHDVRGSVVDARTEEGIADARVQLRGDGPEGTSVLTDAEGNFEIVGVLPGRYTLVAVASGYALAVPGTPLEIADADVDDVQMSLDPGLKIRGRVEPAQLAHVRLDVKPDQMQLGRALFFAASPDGVETDPDGSFELGPVAPGEVTVVAVNADGDAGETAVTIGDTGADEVVVRLQPRARVAGHVRGTDGTPLAQASVTLRPESAPGTDVRLTIDGRDMGTLSAVTTEDGSFEIVGVGEGTHEISIADRYGDEVRIVSGPVERRGPVATLRMTGADRRDLDLQVDAPTGVIDGTVLTDEGEPAPDVWVTLMRRPDPEPAPDADEGGSRHVSRMVIATRGSLGAKRPPVLTGEDGTFRFSGLRDGEYELAAQADGGTSRVTARTRPGRTETLKLAPLGAVEGLASLDGEPIDTFIVAVAGPSSRRKRVRDPGGKFSIDRLDPGHYTLTIRAGSASGDVEVDVEAGRTAKRDVVLQRPATVVGKVTDEGGTPVEGAMVLVGDGSADEGRVQISQDGSDAMIATDDEGKFDFHCAPGARVIVVIEPGQPEPIAVKFFTAEAGARVELGTLTPADKPSRGPPQAVDD